MTDDATPRQTRRRPAEPGPAADHPSGRWELERFGDDVTPPPVDPEAAVAWHRVRSRVTELQVMLAGLVPSVDGLARRVESLEQKDAEMARSLVSVEKTQAVQTSMLTAIERGISDLKSLRSDDGTRFRYGLQVITSLLAAIAAIAVSVISIATR